MGVAERSREQVESKMEELEEVYGSFAVKQTTIALPGEQYADMRERGNPDPVVAHIAVTNDEEEVLHVNRDGEPELPGVEVALGASLEPAICTAVEEKTGIDCVVDGLEQVTIVGLRNADDPDAATMYNLVVVFSGKRRSGAQSENAHWHQTSETVEPAFA